MQPTTNLEALSVDIALWAEQRLLMKRVWLFGSRVREDFRPDSDLDVAIELDVTAEDESDQSGNMALWMFDKNGWREELQALSPYEIHLEQYLGAWETEPLRSKVRWSDQVGLYTIRPRLRNRLSITRQYSQSAV